MKKIFSMSAMIKPGFRIVNITSMDFKGGVAFYEYFEDVPGVDIKRRHAESIFFADIMWIKMGNDGGPTIGPEERVAHASWGDVKV